MTQTPTIISYHIISYHIISYHIISYHIISYHIIYHISYIIYHISYIIYHIISYHIISYHIISYHIISYHIISYHIISYHIISYIKNSIMQIILLQYGRLLFYSQHFIIIQIKSNNSTEERVKLSEKHFYPVVHKRERFDGDLVKSCRSFSD